MSIIAPGLARVPNMLFASQSLSSISRTNVALYRVNEQFATGRAINRPSDDAVRAAAIAVLDERLERSAQRLRNLDHADAALSELDVALGEAHDLFLEAQTIASQQANTGSSDDERSAQAQVVSSLIDRLYQLSNRESVAGYIFGGSRAGQRPVELLHGGYRYVGSGDGLVTDLGPGQSIPLTMGAGSAIGATSARVQGSVDLDPALTPETRLADLAGARGLGVTLGQIDLGFDGGPLARIDLSGADTMEDVVATITAAIRQYESDNAVTILGPAGVSLSGGAISIDVVAGPPDPQLTFSDVGGGVTAKDLGLASDTSAVVFDAASPDGLDLNPRLTWRSPVSALQGVTGALGSIRINNLGRTAVVDLSGAQTLEDVRNLIEAAGLGVRVEINAAGDGIDVVNETAAGRDQALSIAEVPGSNQTATRLGIRTYTGDTLLSDFNDGRGVRIVHGSTDPTTGLPDPARDVDFTITLGDGAATTIDVDLRPEDIVSVQTLIDRINSQAAAQGVNVPADFEAVLTEDANGLTFVQNGTYTGPVRVEPQNNSAAAGDLGLMDGTYDAGTGSFRAQDRATVRVDSLFTALIDLRDALLRNDTAGITLAGERLEQTSERVVQARAVVGAHASRVQAAALRQENLVVLDEKTRSGLRDLDYAEASVRFSQLQLQLQAGLQVTAMASSRTLLDFLG